MCLCKRNAISCKQLMLSNQLRQLWNEHVLWTRFFIVSTAFDLPDLQFVTQRLLQNPCDFAKVIYRFYGRFKAERFKNLLTDHLLIAAALVNAAKVGNAQEVERQRVLWYKNAVEIAKFLDAINPYWSFKVWKELLFEHLRLTEDEAVLILSGCYEKSIRVYQAIQDEAMQMADVMTCGIVRQFRL